MPPGKGRKALSNKTQERKVRFVVLDGFKRTYQEFKDKSPEISGRVTEFNRVKRIIPPIPLDQKFQDHVLTGPLAGIRECHLAHDVLLLYTHADDLVTMFIICNHDDLHFPAFYSAMRKKLVATRQKRAKLKR